MATGFEAAARTVLVAVAGTVTEAAALTAFKGFAAVVVCELATVSAGGAGIVTAAGAETVALKRGRGALVCPIREAAGRAGEEAEVVGDADTGTAADTGTLPGMTVITSSGAGIETVTGTLLVSARGITGSNRDLRCAIIAASCRRLRRIRAIRARCLLHHARE